MRKQTIALVSLAALLGGVAADLWLRGPAAPRGFGGKLTVEHFRPMVAGGCATPLSVQLAQAAFVKDVGLSMMARLMAPAAFASNGLDCVKLRHVGPLQNLIVNEGETALRDCFNANSGTECGDVIDNLNFHGLGTNATGAAEADTGCGTELTTQYNPDNTRATGSQTTNGANIYQTIGTNTVDASAAVVEFCLESASTGSVVTWSHLTFSTINLASSDALQTTYDLTID
jgi:hypothetical protein